jgi:hypothetical protein
VNLVSLLAIVGIAGPVAIVSPAPLVAGAVRDQFGAPVENASVRAIGSTASASTDAQGTFVLAGDGVSAVEIRCDYCEQRTIRVRSGEPVVAIVHRFEAVAFPAPTAFDSAVLPYPRTQTLLSLVPFAVLNEGAGVWPGDSISLYGLSNSGGLVVDRGLPVYDIAGGASPFVSMPDFTANRFVVAGPEEAFAYGDLAEGGTFVLAAPQGGGSVHGGDSTGFDFEGSGVPVRAAATLSSTAADSAQQADAALTQTVGSGTLTFDALDSQRRQDEDGSVFASSFTGVSGTYGARGGVSLSVAGDRGTYGFTGGYGPIDAVWSNASADLGFAHAGSTGLLADAGVRTSAGTYASRQYFGNAGGAVTTQHADAGYDGTFSGGAYQAGVGAFEIAYAGPATQTVRQGALLPSARVQLGTHTHWSATASLSSAFEVPTLWDVGETYGIPAPQATLDVARDSISQIAVDYTDFERVRGSLVSVRLRSATDGMRTVDSSGANLAWQFAPEMTVRSWFLRVEDSTNPFPYDVGAVWWTYEAPHGFRADVVYRRDLFAGAPSTHLDADVSGDLGGDRRWFAGTEGLAAGRSYNAGIRFGPLTSGVQP